MQAITKRSYTTVEVGMTVDVALSQSFAVCLFGWRTGKLYFTAFIPRLVAR